MFSGLWQSWRGGSFCCLPIARLMFYNTDTVARLKIKPFPLPLREKRRHKIEFQASWGSHCTSNHLLIKCIWKDSDCHNVTVVLHSLLGNQSSHSLGRKEFFFPLRHVQWVSHNELELWGTLHCTGERGQTEKRFPAPPPVRELRVLVTSITIKW